VKGDVLVEKRTKKLSLRKLISPRSSSRFTASTF